MRYEKILDEITQITSAILDLDGVYWLLAVMHGPFEELFITENYRGCHLVIRKRSETPMMCVGEEYEDNELLLAFFAFKELLSNENL